MSRDKLAGSDVPDRGSVSQFRQITCWVHPPAGRPYRRDAPPHAASFRRRDRLCNGRVDVRRAHVIFARASAQKSSTVRKSSTCERLLRFVGIRWKRDERRAVRARPRCRAGACRRRARLASARTSQGRPSWRLRPDDARRVAASPGRPTSASALFCRLFGI